MNRQNQLAGCFLTGYLLEGLYVETRRAEGSGGFQQRRADRQEKARRDVALLKKSAGAAQFPPDVINVIRRMEILLGGDDATATRASVDEGMGKVFGHLKDTDEIAMQFFEGGVRTSEMAHSADDRVAEGESGGRSMLRDLPPKLGAAAQKLLAGKDFSLSITGMVRGINVGWLVQRDDLRSQLPPGVEEKIRSIVATLTEGGISTFTVEKADRIGREAQQLVLAFARAIHA